MSELVHFAARTDGKLADGFVHEQLELDLNVLLLLIGGKVGAVLLQRGDEVLQAFETSWSKKLINS